MTENFKFDCLTGSHDNLIKELNHIKQWCKSIEILNVSLGLNSLQQPVLIMFIKLDLIGTGSITAYEAYKSKTPLAISK